MAAPWRERHLSRLLRRRREDFLAERGAPSTGAQHCLPGEASLLRDSLPTGVCQGGVQSPRVHLCLERGARCRQCPFSIANMKGPP